jgi:membrane-bound ClpP family serine protease
MLALLLSLSFALAGSVRADMVVFQDGEVREGTVAYQDDDLVVLRFDENGTPTTKAFAANTVQKIIRAEALAQQDAQPGDAAGAEAESGDEAADPAAAEEAAAAPSYVVLPLTGVVGGPAFDAELLEQALQMAAKAQPSVVILRIDSGGGQVEQMNRMLDLVTRFRIEHGIPLIAYVTGHGAYSAAAILAMACDDIHVAPGAALGGAVQYDLDAKGHAVDVLEKWDSIYRAKCRSAVEAAGHDTRLVEAMTDPLVSLTVRINAEGVPTVLEGTADQHGTPGEGEQLYTLVRQDKVLTLSSSESVRCGLARSASASLDEVLANAGLPGAVEGASQPRVMFERMAFEVEKVQKQHHDLLVQITRQSEQIAANLPREKGKDDKALDTRQLTQQVIELRRVKTLVEHLGTMRVRYPWLEADTGQEHYAEALTTLQARVDTPARDKSDLGVSPEQLVASIDRQIDVLDDIRDERTRKPQIRTMILRQN